MHCRQFGTESINALYAEYLLQSGEAQIVESIVNVQNIHIDIIKSETTPTNLIQKKSKGFPSFLHT